MACQLGVVEVKDGIIVKEKEYLIQPPSNEYDRLCVLVHRITPSMTADSPTFKELWPMIKEDLNGKTIVAHNLSFDMDVLLKNMRYYGLDGIEIPISYDTCADLGKVDLVSACHYFGINLPRHHNALADARSCAQLLLEYRKMPGSPISIPKISETTLKESNEPLVESSVGPCDEKYSGKTVVISGIFNKWPDREDLRNELIKRGARVTSSVSSKTNYLIIGEMPGPSKVEKACSLGIEIITEDKIGF